MNHVHSQRILPILAVAVSLSFAAFEATRPAVQASRTVEPAPLDVPSAPLAPARAAQDTPALYDDAVVRDVAITFERDDWLALLQANGCRAGAGGPPGPQPTATPGAGSGDVPVTMVVDGTRLEQVGVRCKGNSSLGISGSKKPLNITVDAFQKGQDLWGFDVINLNNNWNDPSQLRDAIGLKLLANYMPVPRFTFARVTIQGKYVGLYTMVEQINGEWANFWFDDSGLIVRGDSPVRIAFDSSTLNWRGEDLAPYKQGYEVKGRDDGSDAGYERVRELTRVLDAPLSAGGVTDAAFPEAIRKAMHVDSALWHIAGTSVLAHYDSYYVGKNYYLFAGSRDDRFSVIMWDLGLAFGTFGYRAAGSTGGPGGGGVSAALVEPFAQADAASRPLIRRLLAVPEFRADYLAHYRELLGTVFTEEWILEVGQSYQALIRDAAKAEADTNGRISGSFTYDQFLANLRDPITPSGGMGGPGGGRGFSPPGILALVRERRAFLLGRPDMRSPDVHLASRTLAPPAPATGEAVTVRAAFDGAAAADVTSVQLRYRVAGGFEEVVAMDRDAGMWAGAIPAQRAGRHVTYFFRVGLADGNAAFFPAANWTQPFAYDVAGVDLPPAAPGDLVLNELMADNSTTVADEAGEFEDWVELYNRGSAPVALGGLYLSDDAADPWAFALPDRALAPGEYLLVWCDGDLAQGPLHAPFGLGRQGESVAISSRTAILDTVTFPALAADQSYGRRSDGADAWMLCGQPSPRAVNACSGEVPPATTVPPTVTPTPVPPTATQVATEVPPTRVIPTVPAPNGGRTVFLPLAAVGDVGG